MSLDPLGQIWNWVGSSKSTAAGLAVGFVAWLIFLQLERLPHLEDQAAVILPLTFFGFLISGVATSWIATAIAKPIIGIARSALAKHQKKAKPDKIYQQLKCLDEKTVRFLHRVFRKSTNRSSFTNPTKDDEWHMRRLVDAKIIENTFEWWSGFTGNAVHFTDEVWDVIYARPSAVGMSWVSIGVGKNLIRGQRFLIPGNREDIQLQQNNGLHQDIVVLNDA